MSEKYHDDRASKAFRSALRDELKKSGLSKAEFFAQFGVSGGLSTLWLQGRRGAPLMITVIKLWKGLGRSLDKDFL